MRASEVILVLEIKAEAGFQKSSVSFLSYRKLRSHTIKMLRENVPRHILFKRMLEKTCLKSRKICKIFSKWRKSCIIN